MKKVLKRAVSLVLALSMILSAPVFNYGAEASVTAGINDMTALDALGIDISKAPLGYDPNTTDNPFGKETTSIAVVDELFIVGKSNDKLNYSKLYGDEWTVGGSVDNFLNKTPSMVGNATNGSERIFYTPQLGYDFDYYNASREVDVLVMIEANLDVSKSNDGRKDSVAYVSYNVYPDQIQGRGYLSLGIVDPESNYDEIWFHQNQWQMLDVDEVNDDGLIGNKEDKKNNYEFINDYLTSTYLKITSGDYDGDGIDEIAVYIPNRNNPRIEVYKLNSDWKEGSERFWSIMTIKLDRYMSTKAVGGSVPTSVGDTLIPNMVSLVSEDFNMDGVDDLAISYGYAGKAMDTSPCKAIMVFGEKGGRFGSLTQDIPMSYNGTAIVRASFATGDIDGDGKKELVVGGSLAGANFNPNERYVAIYQWNGNSFSISQSKKFNIFEKDNNGNYINTRVPDNKTEFYSVPVAQANVTIGHFNGISEPVNIYIDSILIEIGDNGMEIAALLDDNLKSTNFDFVEWGARSAQLNGDGTDTLITMVSDVKHDTPAKGNFTGYFNNTINRLNSTTGGKTYMTAVYGSKSGLCKWRNEIDGAAFCLPNTDKDSSTIRYTGKHYYTYIDPEILAVLASPPYFKDLYNNEIGGGTEPSSTSYGTTKGTGGGSSYSNTLSVGLYTSYEKSVSLFGVELFRYEAELEINNHMTWETLNTSTIEQSVSYETLSGQDTVVFFSLPIETYVYEQTYPVTDKDGNFLRTETQSMTVNIPHEASVKNLPLETYERIAADYEELPKISGTVINHTLGMPSTYPSSAKGYGSSGVSGLPTMVSSGDPAKVGYGASSQTKEIAMTSSTENSFNYELDISTKIGAGGGGLMVGITAGYAHGAGTVSISTEGSSYSGTIYALPAEAEAYGYDFNWRLFTYPYKNGNQVFPVVTYIVTDVTQPPMVPDNFNQLVEGTSQGEIALTWQHSGNPAGFTIYRFYRAAGSAGFYEVAYIPSGNMDYVIDTDGNTRTYRFIDTGLTPDTEYQYRIQTVGNSQPGLSVQSETLTAYTKPEGIVPEVSISADELTIYPDTEHTATVSITNADRLAGATLFFQWQKYDSNAKKWSDLSTLNTMTIRFTNAGMDDEGLYRCKVTSKQNTTIVSSYSPVVNVRYSKRTAIMSDLQAVPRGSNGVLSVKLTGDKTKTIPSGTVVFKLEAEGYSKQYSATINSQGIAEVTISAVPGVYKVTAEYNGNRVFKPNEIDTGSTGNSVFYVFGQDTSTSYYWDYADSYTYGDAMKFTKYTIDYRGVVTDSVEIDLSGAINNGYALWRKMELYELPATNATFEQVHLYKMPDVSSSQYRPLKCNETGACTNGVENVLGDYFDTAISRVESGKAGWVGSYYIPYDLDGNGNIEKYEQAHNIESFDYSTGGNPEGFYFTIDKAELNVDFKEEYKDLVRSVSEINLFEDTHKVILTEANYKDYGFDDDEWSKINIPGLGLYDLRRELMIDGNPVLCLYSITFYDEAPELEYRPIEPTGPGAQLLKNQNALTVSGELFNDNPLETVSAIEITNTGLFDKGYIIQNYKNLDTIPPGESDEVENERLFTYPVNLWAFEGHYYESDLSNGSKYPWVIGYENSSDRPADNYYPEHGLNIFLYDKYGNRCQIGKETGQYTLGIEPTYYLNSYKESNNPNLAYIRAHIAENYNITFGTVSMTISGDAYDVSAESDDETKGTVELVTPASGIERKYPVGTQFVFVATPNEGFEVDCWEVIGIKYGTEVIVKEQQGGAQLITTQVQSGIMVKVYFKTKTNTLTFSAEPQDPLVNGEPVVNMINSSIPNGKEPMAGAEIIMTADAAEGWHFVKWEVHTDGAATQYINSESLNIKMPNASIRIYGIFERDSYTLTLGENLVAFSDNKVLNTSKPIVGDTEITVKPAIGNEVIGEWSATEGVEDIDLGDNTFTFKLLKDTEISVDTQSGTYEVAINYTTTGGAITASGVENLQEVKGGTALKFTAVPQRGYKLQNWIVNGDVVSNSSEDYECIVDGDMVVKATFIEKNSRTVTVLAAIGSNADLTYTIDDIDYTENYPDGTVKLYEGETLIVSAVPRANDMVAGWRIDDVYSQSYDRSYTVIYSGSNTVQKVEVVTQSMFKNKIVFETQYEGSVLLSGDVALTAKADGVSISSGASVGAGQELVFKFSGTDVRVSRWTIAYNGGEETDILDDSGNPVTDNELMLPYTLNDAMVTAYFKMDSEFEVLYNVTIGDIINGRVTANLDKAAAGETVTLEVTPDEDYELETLTFSIIDTTDVIPITNTSFDMPEGNVVVNATFIEKETPPVIIGVIVSPSVTSVEKGGNVSFTATVTGTGNYNDGVIWSVVGGVTGTAISSDGVLTLDKDETAATLTVTAESEGDSSKKGTSIVTVIEEIIPKYNLTVINGSGTGEYAQGATVTITADDSLVGKEFDKWEVKYGTLMLSDDTDNPLTFEMPAEVIEIEATYKDKAVIPKTYIVTVSGSSASTSGAGEYYEGDIVYINAGNRSGYSFDGWTSPHVTIAKAGNNNASFTMPANNVSVTANWIYDGGDSSGGNGGSSGNGGGGANLGGQGNVDGPEPDSNTIIEDNNPPVETTVNFEDVNNDDWFAGYVRWAYENGLMKGTSETTFSPNSSASRGMIITILYRLEGSPVAADLNPFLDTEGGYYEDAVIWAVGNKLVSGYGNGLFGPEDSITREQLTVILMNYAKLKGYDVSVRADLSGFADADNISPWAREAMSWANALGLIQGSGNYLMPEGNAQRCQVAAIFQRFVENIAK